MAFVQVAKYGKSDKISCSPRDSVLYFPSSIPVSIWRKAWGLCCGESLMEHTRGVIWLFEFVSAAPWVS